MGIGRLLRTQKAGDEDIVSLIDKQCLQRDVFDFEVVKANISELQKYSEKTNSFEMDEFMKLFFKLNASIYSDAPRSAKVFHPSGISDDCERKLYYEFANFTPTDEVYRKIDGRLQRIFDTGTWWHTYIQMLLWRAGILDKSEVVVRNRKKRIGGRCDGIINLVRGKALLEIKTMNSFSFAKGKIKPFPKHETQAGIYASELGIEWVCFLYINKDTSEIVVHIVPVNHTLVGIATDKMNDVLTAVTNNVAPKRVCCTSENSAMAKVCPFKTQCFKHV